MVEMASKFKIVNSAPHRMSRPKAGKVAVTVETKSDNPSCS